MERQKLSPAARIQLAHDLRTAARELRERGLLVASKWASELLSSLPKQYRVSPHIPFSPPQQPSYPLSSGRGARDSLAPYPLSPVHEPITEDDMPIAGPSRERARTMHGIEMEEEEDVLDEDEWQLAKTYFDMKEFDRVVWTLREAGGRRAKFLKTYAGYLSADRKAQEGMLHFLDTKKERELLWPALTPLLDDTAGQNDPYLLYLRGLIYMRLDQRGQAVGSFIDSLNAQPYNWSCWSQLAQLVKSANMFLEVKKKLPAGPMLSFFGISVMLDLHTATDRVMDLINELQDIFPTSIHLTAQKAMVYYHMRDFQMAEKIFDGVQTADPFRLEEVDIYSNMLYVMQKQAKLGKLAHGYAEIDRNRPEVCALIGNYYSVRGDHSKAIMYFRRALMLNRDYLPAWTLMGHEFVELKNSHAAIESYRKAIDVNAKDYRAWYGLGQAYELLDMPMYAIEYYNQATSLRPYDCRMWLALAGVYESLRRLPDAVSASERALLGADRQQTPGILMKLAEMHTGMAVAEYGQGAISKAAIGWHRRYIALVEQGGAGPEDAAASYLAVGEWEMRDGQEPEVESVLTPRRQEAPLGADSQIERQSEERLRGDWALAVQYLEKVCGTNAPQRDRAEELLRELRVKEARHG